MMMLRITEEKRHGIFLEHGNSFMDFSEYLKQVNAKAKGKRPYFFEDPAIVESKKPFYILYYN